MSLLNQINTQKALPLVSVIPLTPNLDTISSEREDTIPHQIEIGVTNHLNLALGTVKKHLEHIFSKLDTHSRTQAVAKARSLSLLR